VTYFHVKSIVFSFTRNTKLYPSTNLYLISLLALNMPVLRPVGLASPFHLIVIFVLVLSFILNSFVFFVSWKKPSLVYMLTDWKSSCRRSHCQHLSSFKTFPFLRALIIIIINIIISQFRTADTAWPTGRLLPDVRELFALKRI